LVETADRTPNQPELAEAAGRTGWLAPDTDVMAIAAAFPAASAGIGASRVCAIALTSRLVGMILPGLHSVYGSLDVAFTDARSRPGIGFQVGTIDLRARTLGLQVSGSGISGTVIAGAGHDPIVQFGIARIAVDVAPNEFTGTTALITGGSRGLGAMTAKMIAAGGGRVIATYFAGRDVAERLAREIDEFTGRNACTIHPYDVGVGAEEQFGSLGSDVTHLYHFATPRIRRAKSGLFDSALFAEFTRAYVASFHELCIALQRRARRRLVAFFPSSAAVLPRRPRGLTEYAMAKAAGELLCEEMSRTEGYPLALSRRLPRMLTDQTTIQAEIATADALTVMPPIIREVQARGEPGRHQSVVQSRR